MQAAVVSILSEVAATSPLGVGTGPAPSLAQDLAADSSRFSALMVTAPEPPQAPFDGPEDGVRAVAAPSASSAASGPSLGDVIIDKLVAAGETYRAQHVAAFGILNEPGELSMRHMLTAQLRFGEMSMHVELFSKGVSKLLQHVDQLTKLQ